MEHPLITVAIPTFNEKGYIERTLKYLAAQTLYKKGMMEVVIADYKDELNRDDHHLENLCKKYSNARYFPVLHKGIAFARNQAIREHAEGDIIVNFDADSVFNRHDAVELMVRPILTNDAVMTNCEVVFYDFENQKPITQPLSNLYSFFSTNIATQLERYVFARGPGLTLSREAFNRVGGFRDVSVCEDYWMAVDVCLEYSIHKKRFVNDVKVFASDRRVRGFEKHGLGAVDYTSNYYR